jgi:hypothetical protein
MFVTQHFIAFSGWPDTRVLLQMSALNKVEKMNTLMYIPNAISLLMSNQEEYFFGSFIDRDHCFSLIQRLVEVEKSIAQQYGVDDAIANRKLDFGYQQTAKPATTSISSKILGVSTAKEVASESESPNDQAKPVDTSEEEVLNLFQDNPMNFSSTMTSLGLIELINTKLNVTAKEVYRKCWMNASSYE